MPGLSAHAKRAYVSSEEQVARKPRRAAGLLAWVLPPLLLAAWVLPPLLLAACLLLAPGARELNLGALLGHKAIVAARASAARANGTPPQAALAAAGEHLGRALALGEARPSLYSLAGSLAAWQGDYPAALAAFERQVALDGEGPARLFVPYEALRRRLLGEPDPDRWEELVGVYGQWMARFPQRGESYVWAALVRGGPQARPDAAAAVLTAALDQDARPRGLLEYALAQLGQ